MGTSAILAVRYKNKTYYQYASHDSQIDNVIASLTSTISAMGLDALKKAMANQPDPSTIKTDYDFLIDRRGACEVYLRACEKRQKAPFMIETAMEYEYGNPDFSHGGAIALLAPNVHWHQSQASKIEDADFILDLDKNILHVPDYNKVYNGSFTGGEYDLNKFPMAFSIDLNDIENLNPRHLFYYFNHADFDIDNSKEERDDLIKDIISGIKSGKYNNTWDEYVESLKEYGNRMPINTNDLKSRPAIYTLEGTLNHILEFQAILGLLREQESRFPILAEKSTLSVAMHDEQTDEGVVKIQTLYIDLRKNTDSALHSFVSELMRSSSTFGMVNNYYSEGVNTSGGMFGGFSSVSTRNDSSWDDGIIPQNANHLGSYSDFDKKIDDAILNKDPNALSSYYIHSLIDMNQDRLEKIKNADAPGFNEKNILKEVKSHHMLSVALNIASSMERLSPGLLASRFNRLSPTNKQIFIDAFDLVNKYLFNNLLSTSNGSLNQTKPVKKPSGP